MTTAMATTLADLKATASGPILIVGNGPSLASHGDMLYRVVASMDTFCCNRIVQWSAFNWKPTYYACSANAVLKDIEPRDPPFAKWRFLVSRMMAQLAQFDDSWVKVYKKEWFPLLGSAPETPGVRGGGTMVGIMAQLAVWMGYKQLWLVGAEQIGSGHVFDPNGEERLHYFIPAEKLLFDTIDSINTTYRRGGVEIWDATPGGRLNTEGGLSYRPLAEALP